jgi:hypothetical protein
MGPALDGQAAGHDGALSGLDDLSHPYWQFGKNRH